MAEVLKMTIDQADMTLLEIGKMERRNATRMSQAFHDPQSIGPVEPKKPGDQRDLWREFMAKVDPEKLKDIDLKQAATEFLKKARENGAG